MRTPQMLMTLGTHVRLLPVSARFRRHFVKSNKLAFPRRLLVVDASFKAQLSDLPSLSSGQLLTTDYYTRMHRSAPHARTPAVVLYLGSTLLCKHVLSPHLHLHNRPKKKVSRVWRTTESGACLCCFGHQPGRNGHYRVHGRVYGTRAGDTGP